MESQIYQINWTAVSVIGFLILQSLSFIIWIKVAVIKLKINMEEIKKKQEAQGREFRLHERTQEVQLEKFRDEIQNNHNEMNNKIQKILNLLIDFKKGK